MGKTAVIAADLLRGKRKPEFTPNADCGDCVIIINAEKAVLTYHRNKASCSYTYSKSSLLGVPELRLLGGVVVLTAAIDVQAGQGVTGQAVLRHHALDGQLHSQLGLGLHQGAVLSAKCL